MRLAQTILRFFIPKPVVNFQSIDKHTELSESNINAVAQKLDGKDSLFLQLCDSSQVPECPGNFENNVE